ncbi:MAG TPA: hypothetical protein ENJ95_11265 [Bacteroidetes bacterium]|nr:hypothetical protein [Bacteroidota bacterium]
MREDFIARPRGCKETRGWFFSSQGREAARKREDGFFHRKAARMQGNARVVFFIARPRGRKETRGWFFSSQGREDARKREDVFFHRKAARPQGNARQGFHPLRPLASLRPCAEKNPCVSLRPLASLRPCAEKKIPAFLCGPLHLCGLALKKNPRAEKKILALKKTILALKKNLVYIINCLPPKPCPLHFPAQPQAKFPTSASIGTFFSKNRQKPQLCGLS